ncbi:beta-galactosidase [Larkinella insperata]|uniref:Beta-galactosidase n=1 Tax=Larkinella insperata TaxID=332158 RepID=A0ABW3PWN0_9BACT|nr:beta-galactosidase [Larkinella insperata]
MRNKLLSLLRLTFLFGLIPLSIWGKEAPVSQPYTVSSGPVPINQKRYLGVTIFNFEADPKIDDERIAHSAAAGCNAVEITINWDMVYPTRQSPPNWKVVDSHVHTAQRLGLKIALRIFVGRENTRLGGFWTENETMVAADGTKKTGAGIVQVSFAHQPTMDLTKNFVQECVKRYRYLQQQNQLLFISVVSSPALEAEYSPVYTKDGLKGPIGFDYSNVMKQAFRDWLRARFSLTDLNSRWGTSFADWNAVAPPTGNTSDPYSVYTASNRGKDWYIFRHRLLETFLNDITQTIRSVDGAIRVVNQHGAVWDRLSGLRGTAGFKSLNQHADGLKFNDGPDYNHRFSMDVVRGNLKPGAFLINAVDGMFHQSVSIDAYFAQVQECFEHGASMLTLANFGGSDARPALTALVRKVLDAGLLSRPVTQVQTGGTISYKLSEILRDFYGPVSNRWTEQYNKSGKKPVNVHLIEDLLDEERDPSQPAENQPPTVIQPFPDINIAVGKPFSLALGKQHFRDSDGTIARLEVTGLKGGLTYNATTNRITGTPPAEVHMVVVATATDDDGASVTDKFAIRVKAGAQPQPGPEEPEPGPVGVTGNFEGFLDKVECGTIRGWVWDRDKPNTPLSVAFYADGKQIGTTKADINRPDLVAAGKGNGSHAYSFVTPASLKDNKPHQISAKVLNSSYTLKYAPKMLTCPSPARRATESTEPEPRLNVTVLGNPVDDQVQVGVQGAEGKAVRFQLTDIRGRVIHTRLVEAARSIEHQQFSVASETAGLLLLRVLSGKQAVTVNVLKK